MQVHTYIRAGEQGPMRVARILPSALRVEAGRLMGRRWWRSYRSIEPQTITGVEYILKGWSFAPTLLAVRTTEGRYSTPAASGDYEAVVLWLSQHTRFDIASTRHHKRIVLMAHRPVSWLVLKGLAWLFKRNANDSVEGALTQKEISGAEEQDHRARRMSVVKKVATGAIVVGVAMILAALWMLVLLGIPSTAAAPAADSDWPWFIRLHSTVIDQYPQAFAVAEMVLGTLVGVCGIGLRRLHNWARLVLLMVMSVALFLIPFYVLLWATCVVQLRLDYSLPLHHMTGMMAGLAFFAVVTIVPMSLAISVLRRPLLCRCSNARR